MKHVLVIGAGLTGLFAATHAARRGARVTLIAEGRGGLELSHGGIEVLAGGLSPASLASLPPGHPYRRAGLDRIRSAIDLFLEILQPYGLDYTGSLDKNLALPTPAGGTRNCAFAPALQAAGALPAPEPFHLADLAAFRDFSADYAARRLRERALTVAGVVHLPLLDLPSQRDLYAIDLARLFDRPDWVQRTLHTWRPHLTGVRCLGLPAVLGLAASQAVHAFAEEQLGIRLFEIPTLPPSVPGLRLERALRQSALQTGVRLIETARASGLVDATTAGRVAGVVAQTAGGPRPHRADAVILATGGALHGGLVFQARGAVQESVFDLPVAHEGDRARWTGESVFDSQPYSTFGVTIGDDFRPIGRNGRPLFANLFAAGGLLAGCDRTAEGSRQGIDLASAYCAVEEALA